MREQERHDGIDLRICELQVGHLDGLACELRDDECLRRLDDSRT
jgi:hypothetical protein